VTIEALRTLAYDVAGRAWSPDRLAVAEMFAGRTVYIVGSGPSAAKFAEEYRLAREEAHRQLLEQRPALLVGAGGAMTTVRHPNPYEAIDPVIAVNGAIRLVPQADVWLCSEMSVHLCDWFAAAQDFRGIPVLEAGITAENAYRPPVDPQLYPDSFWQRVLWHTRYSLAYDDQSPLPCLWDHDFRAPQGGLACVQDLASVVKEALGTSSARAAHFACLAGAKRVVLYGCELMFSGGQQYATGDRANPGPAPDDAWTNEQVRFRLDVEYGTDRLTNEKYIAKCEPVEITPQAPFSDEPAYRTTRLMLHSSVAFRAILERCSELGMEWEDRSGGLLEPEKLLQRGAEAQRGAV